jgi:hypothetical protein
MIHSRFKNMESLQTLSGKIESCFGVVGILGNEVRI